MGKKRSKTQKQRQVKASNKLANAFAKKLGVGTSSGGVVNASNNNNNNNNGDKVMIDSGAYGKSISSSNSSIHKNPRSSSSSISGKKPMTNSQKFLAKLAQKKQANQENQTNVAGKYGTSSHCHNGQGNVPVCDFMQEAKSLRERELQIEWKRNLVRQNRRQRQKQIGNNKAGAAPFQFTPSSFSLAVGSQKSVDQLVGKVSNFGLKDGGNSSFLDAADASMAASSSTTTTLRIMTPTKQQQFTSLLSTPFSTPKSLTSWNDDDGDGEKKGYMTGRNRDPDCNPWAVLTEEDENNNHEKHPTDQPVIGAAFCFAPPSFLVPTSSASSTTAVPTLLYPPVATAAAFPGTVTAPTEIDPDL